MTPNSVVAWIGAEMEFALSQAVASGDAFDHRPSECGHCVQNFPADLDFRDLPGEAAGFELGADDTLPTADLRFYPVALVVPFQDKTGSGIGFAVGPGRGHDEDDGCALGWLWMAGTPAEKLSCHRL